MSYRWGTKSRRALGTVDDDIVRVFTIVLSLNLMDVSAIEGVRDRETQNSYFRTGRSRVQWPNGKHNIINIGDKAQALDAAPFVNGDVSWKKEHCIFLAGLVLAVARIERVPMRWGGNWDMDGEPITDQDFQDLVHFEKLGG